MVRFMDDVGASVGRGGHRLANEAGRIAVRCRQALAQLLGLPGDAGRVAFTANATHALNAALWGTVRAGERVVVTAFDHNSVLRPAHRLSVERGVEVVLVPGSLDGSLDPDALTAALDGARLLCINAASNVLGTRLDVAALCEAARQAGALTLVDAAQAAGHVPFAAGAADMVAFTGHKGLLGPPGIGALWVRDGVEVMPFLAGGTGGDSMDREMPQPMPDRLEAGTLNGVGIAGLLAGIRHVADADVATTHRRLAALKARFRDGMTGIAGVRVLSPAAPDGVPIVTIASDVVDSATLAARLDRDHGVLVRAGLHCASEVHRLLGTETSGAVRFSLGWCTSDDDILRAVRAVDALVGANRRS